MLRVGVFGAIAVAIVAAPSVAFALAPTRLVYLRGPGAEACGDEAALRVLVSSRVGADPFVLDAPLTIRVEVAATDGRLHGRVTLEEKGIDRGSQDIADRSVAATRCEDLLSSIALAVSVALDAEQALAPPLTDLPAPPPVMPPPPAPSLPPPALTPPTEAVTPPPPQVKAWSVWGALGARVSYGEWAALAFGPDVLVELRYRRYGLALEGRYDVWTPVSVGGASASVGRGTVTLLPCARFGWLVACALATVGETRASGDQVSTSFPVQIAPYAAFGARGGVDVPLLPRLHILGTLDAVGIATPANLQVASEGTVNSRAAEVSAGISAIVSIF